MAKGRDFFTGSVHIIGDPRPSGLDFRVYACVSMHDGMSLKKRIGRGCYATFATLTAEIGCDAANLSRSLKRLVEWGYLTEERQTDRRRKSYRVIFESAESWQRRQQLAVGQLAEKVGNSLSESGRNLPPTVRHYSSLKGLDHLKDKLDRPEGERLAAHGLPRMSVENVSAELANLERAIRAEEPMDRVRWYAWLGTVFGSRYPEGVRNWALKLSDTLVADMTVEERVRWRNASGLGEAA